MGFVNQLSFDLNVTKINIVNNDVKNSGTVWNVNVSKIDLIFVMPHLANNNALVG